MGTNTGIGIGIGIPFKNNALGGDRPYLPPELKARLIGVWTNYGKKNTDADRNIIKNKIPNAGGDLEIINAAYRLNSGFGGYTNDFQEYPYNENVIVKDNTNAIFNSGGQLLLPYPLMTKDVPSFKIKVSGLSETYHFRYYYRDGNGIQHSVDMAKDGNYELPICYNVQNSSDGTNCGFANNGNDIITVEILPEFEGAFVTDGIDDLITSTKTVQEMGITNEVTVVSMIHQIDLNSTYTIATTNYIENSNSREHVRSDVYNYGKTGIYGYSASLINNTKSDIKNILGDEADYYVKSTNSLQTIFDAKFSVVGRISELTEASQVAWYWTIIANKVLTTDQINQVIAYFNLDRTLNPDILCNTIKQGITNENHAEFGDKLIDFSGNGRDIQLNNIAWKGDSGIGKYEMDFLDWVINSPFINERTSFTFSSSNDTNNDIITIYQRVPAATQSFLIKAKLRGRVLYRYYVNNGDTISISYYEVKEGINILPDSADPTSVNGKVGFILKGLSSIKLEQIPSHAGALCLDGVNDFGKVTGMPIYKDYTIVVDYERISGIEQAWAETLISKSYIANQGAFVLMETNGTAKHSYSFGAYTTFNKDDSTRTLLYQSKYKCGDVDLNAGTGIDGDTLWLGTYRDNYSSFFNGAIYSLMSFPYSMSEFLIERQLKKHKLGTLYPNMVEFRPVIKSNASYDNIVFYYKNEKVENGTYLTVGSSIGMHIRLSSSPVNEIKSITVNGIPATFKYHDANNNIYQYDFNLTSKSPQKINITIDEYIRFEDIVQPYPVLLRFKDENGNEVSWGGKFRVGSTITRIGSAADSNLLPNIYNIFGLLLNDNQVTSPKVIVEKTMVFKAKSAYIFDNNEPKCILSPSRLRIPNSSYKLLGYIPDISGHGNHGKINNSAYAEGSGVNEDGSYQLDGVDDHITIPTLSSGGKQVLMKVNWNTINSIIYDQRGSGGFAIYCSDYNNPSDSITVPAYKGRNPAGTTYIDGIRNEYIIASQLRNVTHNIVEILDTSYAAGNINPIIGKSNVITRYGSLALYDFMLFDNISTDDKIKELNEYVGIEAKVELPPYYWDAYGKSNLDEDRDSIKQRGVAVGDYDLTNSNFAYEGMSGYNGYPVVFGANKTWKQMPTGSFTWNIDDNKLHITKALIAGNGLLFSYVKLNGSLLNVKEIPSFKIKVSGLEGKSKFGYRYLATEDATEETLVYLGNGTHELAKSFAPTETLLDLTRNVWVGIFITPMVEGEVVFDCDITIEVLPEYENGLVYDGITDYSKNANIPALDDFTAIIKREWLKKQGCPLIKGSKVYEGGNGNALLLEWDKAYNFVFYKRTDIMEGELPDNISFITPTNYNGNVITRGSEQDTNGICIAGDGNAGFANMVFYKLILYPKTIPLLQINFLKNLMERDEIIDLNNPIFIKNE